MGTSSCVTLILSKGLALEDACSVPGETGTGEVSSSIEGTLVLGLDSLYTVVSLAANLASYIMASLIALLAGESGEGVLLRLLGDRRGDPGLDHIGEKTVRSGGGDREDNGSLFFSGFLFSTDLDFDGADSSFVSVLCRVVWICGVEGRAAATGCLMWSDGGPLICR